MKITISLGILLPLITSLATLHIKSDVESNAYQSLYNARIEAFSNEQNALIHYVQSLNKLTPATTDTIKGKLSKTRLALKRLDLWLRYLEPTTYKKINGPLPVEWETEVFEKYEKPYRRTGAGLTLAELYLEEESVRFDSLLHLLNAARNAIKIYTADSITTKLKDPDHFFFCNRLYLLNLAAIYTTGFECPGKENIIPELKCMMQAVNEIYSAFNTSFSEKSLSSDYLRLYNSTIKFVNEQPADFEKFDHFTFIRDYISPLFSLNQQFIRNFDARSRSYVDYSLNRNCTSLFSKNLYQAQNSKGIYIRVHDEKTLYEIANFGRLLFYDPILSGNNKRSCASCHQPEHYFSDSLSKTSRHFSNTTFLPRNTPSLVNAQYNHLLMLDGKIYTLQDQAKAVITNTNEMGGSENEIVNKVMSCKEYRTNLKQLLNHTPGEKQIRTEHITSAITYYYSKSGNYYSPFDKAMLEKKPLEDAAKRGFNIFMSKAQCATCHFVPQFNGVKPPFVGSEFEVLGTPADTLYKKLSTDKGRFDVNPASETIHAFRTGTIRNVEKTAPYMHNGVFKTLEQVIEFYDAGGGAGHGLIVENQTLSSDSLHLTVQEKKDLLAFMHSLTEEIKFDARPETLPLSKNKKLNTRKVGGDY